MGFRDGVFMLFNQASYSVSTERTKWETWIKPNSKRSSKQLFEVFWLAWRDTANLTVDAFEELPRSIYKVIP